MDSKLSKRVVLGGISTALILISLYGGTIIRTNKLAFMALATFVAALPYIGGSISTGILSYAAAAMLGWLMLPNKLYAAVFALFGIYPFIKLKSERFKVGIEFFIKYLWLNCSSLIYYIFFKNFIYLNSFFLSTQGIIILILAVQILFLIYDLIFTKFIMFVNDRILKNR